MNHAINIFFARVVVINLKARTDRYAEMGEQLQRINLKFESPGVEIFQAIKPGVADGFSSVGARGCFMSHLSVLRQARQAGVDSLLILEDDVNFCDNFVDKFSVLADFLAQHPWGMCYGSYFLHDPLASNSQPCVLAAADAPIGTSAFLAINGPCINELVAYLEAMLARRPGDPEGGPMHIDGAYCWFRKSHPDVTTWLANPSLGVQRSSRTDVHHLRWFDRILWSAHVIAKIRRWRNHFRV